MKTTYLACYIVLTAFLITACYGQKKSNKETPEKIDQLEIATAVSELLHLNNNFNQAITEKNLAALLNLYDSNEMYWLPPNDSKSMGMKSVKDNYSFITSSPDVKLWHVVDKIFVSANQKLATMMGSYHFRSINPSIQGDDGKFFLTLAKEGNDWKIKSDIYNSDFPASGEKLLRDKPNVYIHTYASNAPGSVNAHLIITEEGVILVDALRTTSEATKLAEVIKSFKKPLLAIIITHAHPDHYGGLEYISSIFPQTPIYSSTNTKDDIATDKNGYIRSAKLFIGRDFGNKVPIPNKTIDSVLNLGGIELLFDVYSNGESESLNTFQIKSTNIVFASDLINNKMIPYLVEGHTANWLLQLDQFTKKYPASCIVYPGHGAHGAIEELAAFQKDYITTIRNLVAVELQGKKNLNKESKKRIIGELNAKYLNLDGVTPAKSLNEMNVDAVEDELKKEKSSKNKP